MRAIVFVGPTISALEAVAELDCTYLPPARQGDVFRAVRDFRPQAIGLIDGVFLDVPAVWHRELLWALTQGVHVFGAASMGALRAAELAAFGMRGVGRIYSAYATGSWPGFDEPFEDDDEVAVVHAPAEVGGRALSDAMVDLRDTLAAAETAGIIDRATRDTLVGIMKALHFADRSLLRLSEAAAQAMQEPVLTALRAWLRTNAVPRKWLDARELLRTMAAFLRERPEPLQPSFQMERALVWERFVHLADEPGEMDKLILDELRLEPRLSRDVEHAALGRVSVLRDMDIEPDDDLVRACWNRFREDRALWLKSDVDKWLADNNADAGALDRLLKQQAILDVIAAQGREGLTRTVIDHLRLCGHYQRLANRVRTKARVLNDSSAACAIPEGPDLAVALEWYFEQRLGQRIPRSVEVYQQMEGWSGHREFLLAVWRDYLFEALGQ
jgi:hypothetical protein